MSKIFLSIVLFFSFLHAKEALNWTYSHRYSLKKDQIANIGYGPAAAKDNQKLFFRWTSLIKDRVTVLVNHQGYPHQYVLQNKRNLKSIKLYLLPNGGNEIEQRSYLLISLSDINQGKRVVDFDIFVKDDKKRVMVEF